MTRPRRYRSEPLGADQRVEKIGGEEGADGEADERLSHGGASQSIAGVSVKRHQRENRDADE
jgi:hypothetical protein